MKPTRMDSIVDNGAAFVMPRQCSRTRTMAGWTLILDMIDDVDCEDDQRAKRPRRVCVRLDYGKPARERCSPM